jgi:hypothetical protein
MQKSFFAPEFLVHAYELEAVTPIRINILAVAILVVSISLVLYQSLMLLQLQAALSEWSSGEKITKQFADAIYRPRHATVMKELMTFRSTDPDGWADMMARHTANRFVYAFASIYLLTSAKGSCNFLW